MAINSTHTNAWTIRSVSPNICDAAAAVAALLLHAGINWTMQMLKKKRNKNKKK